MLTQSTVGLCASPRSLCSGPKPVDVYDHDHVHDDAKVHDQDQVEVEVIPNS